MQDGSSVPVPERIPAPPSYDGILKFDDKVTRNVHKSGHKLVNISVDIVDGPLNGNQVGCTFMFYGSGKGTVISTLHSVFLCVKGDSGVRNVPQKVCLPNEDKCFVPAILDFAANTSITCNKKGDFLLQYGDKKSINLNDDRELKRFFTTFITSDADYFPAGTKENKEIMGELFKQRVYVRADKSLFQDKDETKTSGKKTPTKGTTTDGKSGVSISVDASAQGTTASAARTADPGAEAGRGSRNISERKPKVVDEGVDSDVSSTRRANVGAACAASFAILIGGVLISAVLSLSLILGAGTAVNVTVGACSALALVAGVVAVITGVLIGCCTGRGGNESPDVVSGVNSEAVGEVAPARN